MADRDFGAVDIESVRQRQEQEQREKTVAEKTSLTSRRPIWERLDVDTVCMPRRVMQLC